MEAYVKIHQTIYKMNIRKILVIDIEEQYK